MYITITAYNGLEAKTEDFDTIPLSPTGPSSESLKDGMYAYENEFKFELLYEQFKTFKDLVTEVVGSDPTIEAMDIGAVVGPAESRSLRALLRKKAVKIIDPNITNEEFIFAFTHFMQALDIAVYKQGAIIIS